MEDLPARRRQRTVIGVLTLLALIAVGVGVAVYMVGRTSGAPADPSSGAPTDTASTAPATCLRPSVGARLRVAAIGDSITVGNSSDVSRRLLGDESWACYLPDTVEFVGGWARTGATTEDMEAAATPVQADVLVILAGTNDLGWVPYESTAANLIKIAQKVGAGRVVLSSVTPLDPRPELAVVYNQRLVGLAAQQGWTFVDAGATVRTAGNYFKPGLTSDGVHPTVAGAKLLGEAIGAAVVAPA